MERTFLRRLLPVVVALVAVMVPAIPASSAPQPGTGDVYIRDTTHDDASEPSKLPGPFYDSPDVNVCLTPSPCPQGTQPLSGGTAYVFVTLNNAGPKVTGNLEVLYTTSSTYAKWKTDWTPINTLLNVDVPTGGKTVILPWFKVPGPAGSMFCLLVRWVASTDPMKFPETTQTYDNAKNNNNIAWHNVVTLKLIPWRWLTIPITLRGPDPDPVARNELVVTQPDDPFVSAGRMTIDLGPTLGERWSKAGQPGAGIRPVGRTQAEILDSRSARISGLTIGPDESFVVTLSFLGTDATAGRHYDAFVSQNNSRGIDVGGVHYLLEG